MNFIELLLIAVGLSMDAFAVSVGIGLKIPRATFKKALLAGLYFGVFQAVMPVIGYYLATLFADSIRVYDHWIALGLLTLLGIKMLIESFRHTKNENSEDCGLSLKPKEMFPLALATSIDALAVGVSFAFLSVNILTAVSLIGIITLAISVLGIKIGSMFGTKLKSKAEFAGGIILILMGLKIFLEHLNIINF